MYKKITLHTCIAVTLTLAVLLTACSQPTQATPGSPGQDASYTAAAQTIAAQLTEIDSPPTGAPAGTPAADPGTAAVPPGSPAPLETLPNTSTPLPTRTPLPSDTPTVTNTPLPSDTPTITVEPSATPDDPRLNLGDPTWQDTFQEGANWFLFSDEHVEMRLQQGKLWMTAFNADKYDGWMLRQPVQELSNFYMEVTVQTGGCAGLDRYGLLGRASADTSRSYIFGLSCDGRYSLRRWASGSTMLVEWTTSEHILAGANQTNRMGLRAEGSTLSIYANGHLLAQVEDDAYASGSIGLFIGALATPGFTVQVSEVSVWELP
ncbi:MAG: hypothetical protein JXB15_02035 [Anaerolineales bacterium]|nr:hypothetical protein [Anaerolineales bacterium]